MASAEPAKPGASPDAQGAAGSAPASARGVLGVLFGLLLLGALAARLLPARAPAPDGRALLEQWFGATALPFDLEVRETRRLPSGEVLVHLAPRAEPASAEGFAAPDAVTFVHYPLGRAAAELARLFARPMPGMGGLPGPPGPPGEPAGAPEQADEVRDWGELDWGAFRAPYVRVASRRGERTVESVRVNLSQPSFACALVVAWPEDVPASIDVARGLLEVLEPRAGERPPASR